MLGFIALISYSLYLTHMPLMFPAVLGAAKIFDDPSRMVLSWAVSFASLLLLSGFFSALLYYFVERPFIRWSKARPKIW